MLDNYDFEMEFANLRVKYPSVCPRRAEEFYIFCTNDHSDEGYRRFLRQLQGEEFFFVFDLQYLLHRRALERLNKIFNTKY